MAGERTKSGVALRLPPQSKLGDSAGAVVDGLYHWRWSDAQSRLETGVPLRRAGAGEVQRWLGRAIKCGVLPKRHYEIRGARGGRWGGAMPGESLGTCLGD